MTENDKRSVVVPSQRCKSADYLWDDWISVRDEILPEDIRIETIEAGDGFHKSYWVRNVDLMDEEKFVEKLLRTLLK